VSRPRDGGQAFPHGTITVRYDSYTGNQHPEEHGFYPGMSLRAYVATQAMVALIAKTPLLEQALLSDGKKRGATDEQLKMVREGVVTGALAYAGIMIAELEKGS
jgi:hypothetical protein